MRRLNVAREARTAISSALFLTCGISTSLFIGCSLTGIADVNVGECTSDQSCIDALNENEGLYAGCAAFECVSTGEYNQCRRIEGERLDGLDNDCDYLIDESALGKDPVVSIETEEFASGVPGVVSATVASSPALAEIYVQKEDGTAVAIDIESARSSAIRMMAQAEATGTTPNFVIDLDEGCFTPTSSRAQECDINQAVAASGSDLGYFAQVKSQGCADGELRVGAIDPNTPDEFIDRGPGFRNPAYRGVATYGTACTDNGKPACSNAKLNFNELVEQGSPSAELDEARATVSQECGVSQPAIAATGAQALVAFLGAQLRESACDSGPVDIFGLVLHERIRNFGDEFAWADPSGDGIPNLLGNTRSARPPAIQDVPGAGFLLAHGDGDGGIRIAFVPLQESPPGNSGTMCPDDDCESRDGLETAPIAGIEEFTTLSAENADGIRLTLLGLGDEGEDAALAVTWAEGCSATDNNLADARAFVRILRLDLSGDVPEITWEGPTISLGRTRAFPLAVPSNHPFVVSGFGRNDRTARDNDQSGFFVLTRPLSIQAARVTAFDGHEVVPGEVIPVTPSGESRPASLRYLVSLGESYPDQFLMTKSGEGTITRVTFAADY